MNHKYLSNRLIVGAVFILISIFFNTFAANISSNTNNNDYIVIKIPKNTKYFVAADENGKTLILKSINSKGKIENSNSCAICTAELSTKYGNSCKELRENNELRKNILSYTIGKEYANLSLCADMNKIKNLSVNKKNMMSKQMISICTTEVKSSGRIILSLPLGCGT